MCVKRLFAPFFRPLTGKNLQPQEQQTCVGKHLWVLYYFEFKANSPRYSKNKVFFTVPCACTREAVFLAPSTDRIRWGRLHCQGRTGIFNCGQRQVPVLCREGPLLKGFEFRTNLQGTVKTRYFLLYLAYVREKRYFCSIHRPNTMGVKSTVRVELASLVLTRWLVLCLIWPQ